MLRPLFAITLLLTIAFGEGSNAIAQTTPADRLKAIEAIYPPWQHGKNNDAIDRGFEFTVPPADVLADFHGSLNQPELVLYASGNYFFAMGPLVSAFGDSYPQYRGRVFYETLPPGSDCAPAEWQREPLRITFHPAGKAPVGFDLVPGSAVLVEDASDDADAIPPGGKAKE